MEQSKATGIKKGDTVRLFRTFGTEHKQISGRWLTCTEEMDKDIGEQFTVLDVTPFGNFVVNDEPHQEWPWYCVELTESVPTPPSMYIENKEVVFYNGYITLDGLTINLETLDDILVKLYTYMDEAESVDLKKFRDMYPDEDCEEECPEECKPACPDACEEELEELEDEFEEECEEKRTEVPGTLKTTERPFPTFEELKKMLEDSVIPTLPADSIGEAMFNMPPLPLITVAVLYALG